jgi:hypothetical protein
MQRQWQLSMLDTGRWQAKQTQHNNKKKLRRRATRTPAKNVVNQCATYKWRNDNGQIRFERTQHSLLLKLLSSSSLELWQFNVIESQISNPARTTRSVREYRYPTQRARRGWSRSSFLLIVKILENQIIIPKMHVLN